MGTHRKFIKDFSVIEKEDYLVPTHIAAKFIGKTYAAFRKAKSDGTQRGLIPLRQPGCREITYSMYNLREYVAALKEGRLNEYGEILPRSNSKRAA